MSSDDFNTPANPAENALTFISKGEHAFGAYDDEGMGNLFVDSLQQLLSNQPIGCIDGGAVIDRHDFAVLITRSRYRLVSMIGAKMPDHRRGIASSLEIAMKAYDAANKQGFLVLNNMDPVINMQRRIEFEGPLQSIMQLRNNIAVVIVATKSTIDKLVGDRDRPFFMSFRVFRL